MLFSARQFPRRVYAPVNLAAIFESEVTEIAQERNENEGILVFKLERFEGLVR